MKISRTDSGVLLFLTLFCSFTFNEVRAELPCDVLLNSSHERNAFGDASFDETDSFIVYLESLLEEGIIGDAHLFRFIMELERGAVRNPLLNEISVGSVAEIHGKGIQEFIDRGLNRDLLLKWARKKLAERTQASVKRDETKKTTTYPFRKIEFHPVPVGRIKWGKRDILLTHPIEMMSTPVTQKHWVDLMGENPSRFQEGVESFEVRRNGELIQMRPDNPVEQVTLWSVFIFANRLSEKHGLKPTYDLSGINWRQDTRAENGSLKSSSEDGVGDLRNIKINAKGGVHGLVDKKMYYQAEGYRLPTEAEQYYMLRGAGTSSGTYYFDDDSDLINHAWIDNNSHDQTHPVAELKPLVLDGHAFYDLQGNVWEWGLGWSFQSPRAEKDAVASEVDIYCLATSGGYWEAGCPTRMFHKHVARPHMKYRSGGFRLVRTIGSP